MYIDLPTTIKKINRYKNIQHILVGLYYFVSRHLPLICKDTHFTIQAIS